MRRSRGRLPWAKPVPGSPVALSFGTERAAQSGTSGTGNDRISSACMSRIALTHVLAHSTRAKQYKGSHVFTALRCRLPVGNGHCGLHSVCPGVVAHSASQSKSQLGGGIRACYHLYSG